MTRISAEEFRENGVPVDLAIEARRLFQDDSTLITFDPEDPRVVV